MSSYTVESIRINRVLFFSLAISFLFFFFNLFAAALFFYAGIFLLGLSMFTLSEKEMFLMISFLIPNLFMFKLIGSKSAILGYFFVLVSVKNFIYNYKGNIRVNLSFFTHIIFALMTCIIYSDQGLLTSLVRFVFNFCLFSYCATLFSRGNEIKQVVKMYFAGIVTAVSMGIIYHYLLGDLNNGLFAGVNSGRNYFGAVISPTITFVALYFLEKKVSFSETVLYVVTTVLCLISIALSGSRTSVLCLAIPVLMYVFCFIKSFRKFNKKLIPLALLLAAILVFVYMNYREAILRLLARFGEDDVKTGNNRFELWVYYLQQSFRSPVSLLFGSGSISKTRLVEHNTIIQSLYQLGVIASTSLLVFIYQTFRKITKGTKVRLTSFFPLVSIIVPYCGINGLYADQLSYLIVLCFMIMNDFSKTQTVTSANGIVDSLSLTKSA